MRSIATTVILIFLVSILITAFSPSLEENTAEMSFNKYYSEERQFTDESLGYTHDNYIYYVDGWLYRQDIRDWSTTVLLKEKTSYVYPFRDFIYCVINDSQIIKIDCDGNNQTFLYDAEMPIDVFYGNEAIFFFSSGVGIYRYHIASDTLELIITESNCTFEPLSNDRILLHQSIVSSSICCSCDVCSGTQTTYEYIISQNKKTEYHYPDDQETATQTRSLPTSVNGQAIPYNGIFGNFSSNRYYNSYGNQACSNTEHDNLTTCGTYNRIISGVYQGQRYQCYAFGEFIFDYIWFNNQNIQNKRYSYSFNLGSTASIRQNNLYKYLSSVPIGSHIRYQKTGNSNYHSAVVTDLTPTQVGLYHANYAGNCRIYHGYRSIYDIISGSSGYATKMVLTDIYNHMHTSLSSQWLPNASTHVCIICGYAASHSGSGTCTVCGYSN